MFKSKLASKYLLIFLSLMAGLVWLAVFSFPDNKLHLVFCDVGQGDAILITKGFNQILIDGGPNEKVLTCLSNNLPFWDKKIEIMALTHPDSDHLTGLVSVLEKYKVDYFLSGPERSESAVFQKLSELISCKDDPCRFARIILANPYAGEKIKLGEIRLNTIWPEKEWVMGKIDSSVIASGSTLLTINSAKQSRWGLPRGEAPRNDAVLGASTTHSALNDFSLVFLMEYKDKKVLLMGDADSKVQNRITGLQELVNSPKGIDILKFPHHGSKTGITEEFLQKINPQEAVISVGKNSFGHPTSEALGILQKAEIKIRRTDLEGDIKYEF